MKRGRVFRTVVAGAMAWLGVSCSGSDLAERAMAVYLASTSKQVFVNDFSRTSASLVSEEAWAVFRMQVYDQAFYVGPMSLTKHPWSRVRALAQRGAFRWEIHSSLKDPWQSRPRPDALWASFGSLQDGDLEGLRQADEGCQSRCVEGVLVQTPKGVDVPSLSRPGPAMNEGGPPASLGRSTSPLVLPHGVSEPSPDTPSEWHTFLDVLGDMNLDSYLIGEGSAEAGRKRPPVDWSGWPEHMKNSFLKAYPQLAPGHAFDGFYFDVFATGFGHDAKGPFLGFVLHYADPSQMNGEAERVKSLHQRLVFHGTLGVRMQDIYHIEHADIQTQANVLFAKYYQREPKPNRIWYQLWLKGDGCF